MNEKLLAEIAAEGIAPEKRLIFTTSDEILIEVIPLDIDRSSWTLRRGMNEKTFISRTSLDEVPAITITMIDFFNTDGWK